MESSSEIYEGIADDFRPKGIGHFLKRLLRVRLAAFGGVIILLLFFCALFAPIIAPSDPGAADGYRALEGPSKDYLLGTDHLGRDILSRLIFGSRISLFVAVCSIGITVLIAVPLGLVSGYLGGRIDTGFMRLMDTLYAFPPMLLALALVAAMGPSISNVIIAVGIVMIPTFARLARAQTLSIREQTYVIAARTVGVSTARLLVRHIWPNIMAAIIVQTSLGMAGAILAESGLSYLGVGVRPPIATWGVMLADGFPHLESNPWLSIIPGMAIFLTVLSLNLVGDALRDVLDPRLRGVV
jgi:peptide/nickel transport system permease protein